MQPIFAKKPHWLLLLLCALTLSSLLSACELFGLGGDKKPSPTTQDTSTALVEYKGDGYSISYPGNWKKTEKTNSVAGKDVKVVQFTDTTGLATMLIEVVPNPNEILPADTVVDAAAASIQSNTKNSKEEQLSPATVGGQPWQQKAITGDVTDSGQTANIKLITLAANYPAKSLNTKLFVIAYSAPTVAFDGTSSLAFQPMLQSFKFA